MAKPINLTSVGQFASEQRLSVPFIRDVADRLRIQPELVLDHVPYYTSSDLDRIAEVVRNLEKPAKPEG